MHDDDSLCGGGGGGGGGSGGSGGDGYSGIVVRTRGGREDSHHRQFVVHVSHGQSQSVTVATCPTA